MIRACLALVFAALLIAPAAAQTQEEGQMRLYIQQLEEQVRQLTGANERLTYDLNQMRAQQGLPPLAANSEPIGPDQTGTVPNQDLAVAPDGQLAPGTLPQDLGQTSPAMPPSVVDEGVAPSPMPATDPNAPIDLGRLATGETPVPDAGPPLAPAAPDDTVQVAGPVAPPPVTALSGSPRDEYDLAYGYILTGDYNLAEESFRIWLTSFPGDPLAVDAEFWLGESHLQQGEYRDAATAFLDVYKLAPNGSKGPDSLLKLGMALSALGEKPTACSTFAELGKRYPQASESIMSRAHNEAARAGC